MAAKKKDTKDSKVSAFPSEKKNNTPTRGKGTYIGTIVILIIVVISFVLVPALAGRSGSAGSVKLGEYAGRPIEYYQGSYFAKQVSTLGGESRYSDIEDFRTQITLIWRNAFTKTATHFGILHQIDKSGVSVSEKAVERAIVNRGPFRTNGEFDPEAYRQASTTRKEEIRTQMRETLLKETFNEDIMPGNTSFGEVQYFGVRTSSDLLDFVYHMADEERRFAYAALTPDDYPEDQVRAYAAENPDLFRKIQLKQITVPGRDEAESILQKLENGEDTFDNLVQAYSRDSQEIVEKGGDLGWKYFFEIQQALNDSGEAQKIFSLSSGEVSPMVEAPAGYRLYKAVSPSVDSPLKNQEFLEDVRIYMNKSEKGMIEDYLLAQAENLTRRAEGGTFLETAAEQELDHDTTDFFPLNYGNIRFIKGIPRAVSHDAFSGASYNEDFLKKAFSLKEGEISEPIFNNDSVLVLQLTDTRPRDKGNMGRDIFDFSINQNFARYNESLLQKMLLDSPKFQDNFNEGFTQVLQSFEKQ